MKNNTLKKLNLLKENLESVEPFEGCISTRDTEEDVKDFKKYVKKCLKIVNSLIKAAKKGVKQ